MIKQKISKLFEDLGYDYRTMTENKFYPVSGYQILSLTNEKEKVWKNITHLVKKTACTPVCVEFENSQLLVSPEHKFLSRVNNEELWVEAFDLVDNDVELFHESKGWVKATCFAGQDDTDILDLSVEDTECYFSNGLLSHNTMYGDPTCVPGGKCVASFARI